MAGLDFDKMHGLGNCFVLMDDRGDRVSGATDPVTLARAICDRDTGIGADGLLLARDAAAGGLAMRILNADGSEAEMCGNGIRCFARFALDSGSWRWRPWPGSSARGSCPAGSSRWTWASPRPAAR
jgi:diaminopimelate epimerase